MSFPLILTSFLLMLSEQINFILVGDLEDTEALSAVGLGNMVINMFALSTTFGMNSSMETLVS